MRKILDLFFEFPCLFCQCPREQVKSLFCLACQSLLFEQCLILEKEDTPWGSLITLFENEGPAQLLYKELTKHQERSLIQSLAAIAAVQGSALGYTPSYLLDLSENRLEKKWTKALAKFWDLKIISLKEPLPPSELLCISSLTKESLMKKMSLVSYKENAMGIGLSLIR